MNGGAVIGEGDQIVGVGKLLRLLYRLEEGLLSWNTIYVQIALEKPMPAVFAVRLGLNTDISSTYSFRNPPSRRAQRRWGFFANDPETIGGKNSDPPRQIPGPCRS